MYKFGWLLFLVIYEQLHIRETPEINGKKNKISGAQLHVLQKENV